MTTESHLKKRQVFPHIRLMSLEYFLIFLFLRICGPRAGLCRQIRKVNEKLIMKDKKVQRVHQ